MKDKMIKYASIILDTCLKIDIDKPLFISVNKEREDFANIIKDLAIKKGVKDIYIESVDTYKKHELLLNKSIDDLKETPYFNKKVWNEYALKGAAFLMLASEMPGLMKDVDPKKISELTTYSLSTRKDFDDLRDKNMLPWCIACVPTSLWSKKIFGREDVDRLWNTIFEICHIEDEGFWDKKLERLENEASLLNKYHFSKLRYSSNNGTNFTIGLPTKHIWETGYSKINNKKVLVNFPTEEVFTSPDRLSINGVVYNSKPLSYQDNIIDNFHITFEDGKVTGFEAETGYDTLKELLSSTPNIDYLGEVAIVEKTSSINKTGLIFYETLFDENAACHIALGDSFPECYENGNNMSKDELFNLGLNNCLNHVDFMIGTDDLNITGITSDNKEYKVLEDGIFVLK